MRNILRSLGDFIKVCQQHPLGTLLAFLMLALIAFGWTVIGNFELILDHLPTSGEQREIFQQTLSSQGFIETEIETVMKSLQADRVLLFRFHTSGATDFSGAPLTVASITNSALGPGVSIDARLIQPFPLTALTTPIREMWQDRDKPRCLVKTIDQITTPVLKARLEARGVQVIFSCPLQDHAGTPSGFLSAEYMHKEVQRPADRTITSQLTASAERIEGYLLMVPPETRRRVWP